MQFKQEIVQCLGPSGLHRMAYTEWGAPDNPRVLICVHGLTRNARTGVFAARAAPVQVNYLGYPGTMGADFMDYIVADPTVIPDDKSEDFR